MILSYVLWHDINYILKRKLLEKNYRRLRITRVFEALILGRRASSRCGTLRVNVPWLGFRTSFSSICWRSIIQGDVSKQDMSQPLLPSGCLTQLWKIANLDEKMMIYRSEKMAILQFATSNYQRYLPESPRISQKVSGESTVNLCESPQKSHTHGRSPRPRPLCTRLQEG